MTRDIRTLHAIARNAPPGVYGVIASNQLFDSIDAAVSNPGDRIRTGLIQVMAESTIYSGAQSGDWVLHEPASVSREMIDYLEACVFERRQTSWRAFLGMPPKRHHLTWSEAEGNFRIV